jgi:hypothetical protein
METPSKKSSGEQRVQNSNVNTRGTSRENQDSENFYQFMRFMREQMEETKAIMQQQAAETRQISFILQKQESRLDQIENIVASSPRLSKTGSKADEYEDELLQLPPAPPLSKDAEEDFVYEDLEDHEYLANLSYQLEATRSQRVFMEKANRESEQASDKEIQEENKKKESKPNKKKAHQENAAVTKRRSQPSAAEASDPSSSGSDDSSTSSSEDSGKSKKGSHEKRRDSILRRAVKGAEKTSNFFRRFMISLKV